LFYFVVVVVSCLLGWLMNDDLIVVVNTTYRFVVMLGNMCDTPEDTTKINELGKFYKPWFFKHVEDYLVGGWMID